MATGFEQTYRIVADLPAGDALKAQRAVTADGREVVVKTVKPVDPELFVRGLVRLSEVTGPHNEHVLAWESQGRYVALAAEPVPGADLGHVPVGGSRSPQAAAALAAQAARGLAALHERGLVHGGVRPASLLRDDAGNVVLIDAGLVQAQGGADLTDEAPPREAAYVSPEEVLGRALVPASDVYSLGVVLYQLVTGRLPFDGQNAFTVAEDHVGTPVIAPRRLNPAVPASLEAVILRALAKLPEDRYRSGRELAAALEDESQTTLVAAPAAAPAGPPRRRVWPWIVAAAVVVAAVLAVLWATGVFTQKATVPNVVGANLTSAQATFAGAGFKLGTIAYQQAVGKPQGTILSQDPGPGTQAAKGAAINVVAVGSTVQTVPNVIGMTQSAAAAAITAAGLVLGHVAQVYDGTAPAGTVTDQAPNAGLTAPAGSQVAITVSRGPMPSASPSAAAVPGVVGQTEAQATAALQAAGFTVVIDRLPSATAPAGTVTDQTPAAGVVAERGTTVTIVVSNGPATSSPLP